VQRALKRYDVAYQPGAPQVELRRQRFEEPQVRTLRQ